MTEHEGLQRFLDAQENGYDFGETYQTALHELKQGQKITHWIWYVFPLIHGLWRGPLNTRFAIRNLQEAKDYYAHPVLGARLTEAARALLDNSSDDLVHILNGETDAYKVRSCMTLFRQAAPEQELFTQVLERFCFGTEDPDTLTILEEENK